MLTRLAEIGMGIAEDAGRRSAALADGGAAGTEAPDPALAFARAARAVRMTIALQSRLLADLAGLDRAEGLARAADASARRERIHRRVERAIEAAHDDDDDADEVERLSMDAWERLVDADEDDLVEGPLDAVVARICADLGLRPDGGDWPDAQACGGAQGDGLPLTGPDRRGRSWATPPRDGAVPWDGGREPPPLPLSVTAALHHPRPATGSG